MSELEYKFVKVEVKVVGLFAAKAQTNCREIIEQHANEGWRFVQAYSPHMTAYGRPIEYDLQRYSLRYANH